MTPGAANHTPPAAYTPPPALRAAGRDIGVPQTLLVPRFLSPRAACGLLRRTLGDLDWQQERLTMFGRERTAPRLTAWHGSAGTAYRYSGVERTAAPWPRQLRALAARVGRAVGWSFNFVLATRYRDGRDSLGWHSDDERDLGAEPVIAAVSLGAPRTFRIRSRGGGRGHDAVLEHGSLLLMWGRSQRDYRHCVPRRVREQGERVCLTFRRTANLARGAP